MRRVSFVDTSVLCELLAVPGKSQESARYKAELKARLDGGEQFVVPLTAVIETGNHIAQAGGDRRAAASRLVELLRRAMAGQQQFLIHEVEWDAAFLVALCDGDSTATSFVDLAGSGRMGAGDVAILVERDRFVATTAYRAEDVGIWTKEAELGAFA